MRSAKPDRAQALRAKAAALFERFNAAFWDEELGFYAYALDGEKRKVLTVASNAGHCLWSGIVPPERAKKVVERLMAPDMWTGWGIRTLSAQKSGVQSIQLSDGFGLAARQRDHRDGFQVLWLRRGGGADRARHQRCGELFPAQPVAGAVHRVRARGNQLPSPIHRRECAASLGSRIGLHADPGSIGLSAGCAAQQALCRPVAAEMAARPRRPRPSHRQAQARHPLLARGGGYRVRGDQG